MSGAVGHKRIPKEYIESTKIYLPPIADQEHIVAKLEAAFVFIDEAIDNNNQKLLEVKQLYANAISKIYFSDKKVPIVPLSKISKIKGGRDYQKVKSTS